MQIIIIMGPPYSGKGTQCDILKEEIGYNHISTGDRCRTEKENETEIGRIMSQYEEKGDYVPDEIMKKMLSQIVEENIDSKGIILDGYPRTKAQVDDLIELLNSKGLIIDKVLNIDVPKDELLIRAKKRAETSNRKDDLDHEIHLKRIKVFELFTRHAIEYMKSKHKVISFDGLGSVNDITQKIKESLYVEISKHQKDSRKNK